MILFNYYFFFLLEFYENFIKKLLEILFNQLTIYAGLPLSLYNEMGWGYLINYENKSYLILKNTKLKRLLLNRKNNSSEK